MTNVRGTGWDWSRNKFSLPSGARGRRKHTRLPKVKDRDHFREESTSAKRRAKNARRELLGVAASSSQTPTIKNQVQPRKIERPLRRSNMEMGRARTPTRRISSNAFHITPPANTSTNRFGMNKLCRPNYQTTAAHIQHCQSLLITHHKYLQIRTRGQIECTKGCRTMELMKIPGCNKTKGAVRKGDIIIIIITLVGKKSEQGKKWCWYQNEITT